MSYSRQTISQSSTSSSPGSSTSRVQEDTLSTRITGTLRLRVEDNSSTSRNEPPARRIRWSADVVDNEGMGKKSSKVCCIYHKARPVGESSSESESESSDSDSSYSDGHRDSGNSGGRRSCQRTHHHHDRAQGLAKRDRAPGTHNNEGGRNRPGRNPSPNAYEKMPKKTKS
ncbi:phosphatase inhibitor-domain-containing protein [Aspergillus crustosus]